MRACTHLFLASVSAVCTAQAQVDVIYTNISSTLGEYYDSIVLWGGGGQRPLASENTVRGATGSVRKMRHRVINGRSYLYWINAFVQDGVFRARDANGNGVLDASEFETAFTFDALSDGQLDEANGAWWVSNASASGTTRGLWRMVDGNGDGDFMDPLEATLVVAGPTHTYGATTISTDDIRAVVAMGNNDVVFHEDDVGAFFRCTPGGVVSEFLVYKATANMTPPGVPNPDFGTALPAVTIRLDRMAHDPATGAVFVATNFNSTERFVFRCLDGNNDGDANDAGEVTLFFDGSTANWGPIDDIEWLNGSLYVSYEIDPTNDPGCQFLSLTDLNNDGDARDAGESSNIGRTASTDDPTLLGITVVPAGTFGASCVDTAVENSAGMTGAGGTVNFSIKDAPAARQGGNVIAFLGLSVTGDSGVPLPGGCIVGLFPDPVTIATLPVFVTAPITGRTAAFPAFNYPAGLPAGMNVYFAALLLDTTSLSFASVTGTGIITVQ